MVLILVVSLDMGSLRRDLCGLGPAHMGWFPGGQGMGGRSKLTLFLLVMFGHWNVGTTGGARGNPKFSELDLLVDDFLLKSQFPSVRVCGDGLFKLFAINHAF